MESTRGITLRSSRSVTGTSTCTCHALVCQDLFFLLPAAAADFLHSVGSSAIRANSIDPRASGSDVPAFHSVLLLSLSVRQIRHPALSQTTMRTEVSRDDPSSYLSCVRYSNIRG